jgi:phosphatidylserine decarboxylase
MSNIVADLKKVLIVPIHKEGYKFIAIFGIVAFILALINSSLGLIGLILTLWCVYFFRNPTRFTLADDDDIISPADGVVNNIENNASVPEELDLDPKEEWTKISVFLNVFDVHVNRLPASGEVLEVKYKEGLFLSANSEDASEKNERSSVLLKTKNNQNIVFSQVAGLVARRIFNELKKGDEVKAGKVYGIIRFGSRTDIYLPKGSKIKTLIGQRMIGGETIIAKLTKTSAVAKTKPKSTAVKKTNKK